MNPNLFTCLVILLAALHLPGADAQNVTLKVAELGEGRPIHLEISMPGGGDILLKRSVDLSAWQPFLTIYSTVDHFTLWGQSSPLDGVGRTTFVTASPAVQTPEQMLEAWRSQGFTAYRFKFQRTCFCFPIDLSADVTVRDGKVVAAENISDGRGTPDFTVPLDRFKSIEELHAMIATLHGQAALMQIAWDATLPFPTWIYIDGHQPSVDDEIEYRISDVVRIE
jgi:hypothetical protein